MTNKPLKLAEIFLSMQGEGIDMGLLAVFVRMAGCNLSCDFCDTDYKRKFDLTNDELVKRIVDHEGKFVKYVIFTGGEPLLQNIYPAIKELRERGYRIGLETNGLIAPDHGLFDCISFSPKTSRAQISLSRCDNIKIIYPYMKDVEPDWFTHFPAKWRGVQPMDVEDVNRNHEIYKLAIAEVERLGHPWRISPQVHKLLGMQ